MIFDRSNFASHRFAQRVVGSNHVRGQSPGTPRNTAGLALSWPGEAGLGNKDDGSRFDERPEMLE